MLKSFVIKIVAKSVQLVGLIYRPHRRLKNISTILVNKADRIGDAIVVLPLLLELKKYFQITVLTTKRNDFLFKHYFKTEIILDEPRHIYSEIKSIIKAVLCIFKRASNKNPEYDLYLDLNGIREIDFLVKLRKENRCRYYAGLNSGPFNVFLDYAYDTNSMLFSKRHILDTFKRMIKESLGIEIEIPDYIDLQPHWEKQEDIEVKSPFILININGAKDFRGPSVKLYSDIVKDLLKNRINFLIMDGLGQPNLKEFKNYMKDNFDNVLYLDRNISLWQLSYISSKSLLYIGADSGVSHFLNIPTNVIIFFGTGIPWVWRPYSRNPYTRNKSHGIIIEETRTSKGFIKKVIYRPAWCRPCFDIGCKNRSCIQRLTEYRDAIVKEVEEVIVSG